jgi:predicted anti-sigma-YlaC factor YlaD
MNCDEFRPLITGYLDDELSPKDRNRLEEHISACEACAQVLAELTELKEELSMLSFEEPSDAELERYWRSIYNRLERGVGWVLFSVGAILLLCYGAFKLIEEVVKDPSVAAVIKVGVVALLFGTAILFVSLLRERLAVRRVDKYSKEVRR